jgi:hypothetical protein
MHNGKSYTCNVANLSSNETMPGIVVWEPDTPVTPVPVTPVPVTPVPVTPVPVTPVPVTPIAPVAPIWGPNVSYNMGDVVVYQGQAYKCINPHKSITTWHPSIYTSALWQAL